jgi:Na+/H+ antiporter NhaD/arsenite permease-like protein
MTTTIVVVFLVVYLGMILGGLPFVQLDRTGVALLGAIAIISFDAVSLQEAAESIHLPTIILLFSFMVISAQCASAVSMTATAASALRLSPSQLLGAMMIVVMGYRRYSATISCASPSRLCCQRVRRAQAQLVPYLLALACAANIGSAATLNGNPQNMLMGKPCICPSPATPGRCRRWRSG